eukprot:CAMPEP_0174749848 /NCGR_PEP_ID=MMETSP1094-20130205/96536_1 /TAXON_ID=156173 /ORGANISM="Chrysochromulina brevifilum, Strain UTEX LB 985" /LENGTH=31 /DNA_ID= /DNA_START= /DNA_END= /DNA_ORIENTATION=
MLLMSAMSVAWDVAHRLSERALYDNAESLDP